MRKVRQECLSLVGGVHPNRSEKKRKCILILLSMRFGTEVSITEISRKVPQNPVLLQRPTRRALETILSTPPHHVDFHLSMVSERSRSKCPTAR